MEDIKKNYVKAIQELNLSQCYAFIRALQIIRSNYGGYTINQYYLLLTKKSLYDQFIM